MIDDMGKRRAKGTGTIENCRGRKRPRLTVDGEVKSLGVVDTKEEAEAILEAVRADLALACSRVSGGLTLKEWGETFLKRRKAAAYRGYKTDENRWNKHIKEATIAQIPIAAITPADVREWLDRMLRKPAAPGKGHKDKQGERLSRQTLQNTLNLLRVGIEAAVERDIITVNPARGVHLPMRQSDLHRASEGDPWTWLSDVEQEQLLAACPEPERYVVAFALATGIRQGEQWNLELRDVHLDSPHPHVIVRYGGPNHMPPKNGRIRVVPLMARARAALNAWQAATEGKPNFHKLAFPTSGRAGHTGRNGGGFRRAVGPPKNWEDWLLLSGVKGQTGHSVCWHSLRHSCASMLVSGTFGRVWSLEEVRELLGHKHIATTERYAHIARTALVRAADETDAAAAKPSATVAELPAKAKEA